MLPRLSARGPLAAVVLAGLLLGAPAARGELERVEAFGVVPADATAGHAAAPREDALAAAIAEAVLQVALSLHAREVAGQAGSPGQLPDALDLEAHRELEAQLRAALGSEPIDYTTRFRILEDRGRRPRLLLEDPEVESEYVVLAEVQVDVDLVRARLAEAGLFRPSPGPDRPASVVRLVLLNLRSWWAYESLRAALEASGAARAARPVRFERGRAVLEVETASSVPSLVTALEAALPAGLAVTPVEARAGEITLRVVESRPPPAPGGDASEPGTPSARGVPRTASPGN